MPCEGRIRVPIGPVIGAGIALFSLDRPRGAGGKGGVAMVETGEQLIGAIRGWLRRYLVLTPAQDLIMALWIIHSWCYERLGRTTPYVEITGVSGSGKTALLDALTLTCRGAEKLQTIRTMYICRRIREQAGLCTILIDEAEKLSSDSFGDQRSMIAGGYRDGGVHGVTVGKGTIRFPVWCPKAFTAVRSLTPVIHNRCIPIWMELGNPAASLSVEWDRAKATAGELVDAISRVLGGVQRVEYIPGEDGELTPIVTGRKPARKVVSVEADWLGERDREIWTPLITLAHTLELSAETIAEVERASVDLSALRGVERRCDVKANDEAARERSMAVRLLHDVKACIQPGESFIPTAVLLERLHAMSKAPWRVYQRAGLTDIQLAQLLGAHGLQAKVGQIGKGKTRKQVRGYAAKALQDVKL